VTNSIQPCVQQTDNTMSEQQHPEAAAAAAAAVPQAAAPSAASIPPALGPRPLPWLLERLRSCDAVAFDVDSTVSAEEGIDVLAESLGADIAAAVKAYTAAAMGGAVPFEVSLKERLDLMRPSAEQVVACVRDKPASFSPGFEELLAHWRAAYARWHPGAVLPVFLVSGGFRPLIEPLRLRLGLPESHVYANELRFDAAGKYQSFDQQAPTSRSGGKACALEDIMAKHGFKRMAMLGDGATDLEACPPATLMIGYGGIAAREKVQQQAHGFITHWTQLRGLIDQADAAGSADSTAQP